MNVRGRFQVSTRKRRVRSVRGIRGSLNVINIFHIIYVNVALFMELVDDLIYTVGNRKPWENRFVCVEFVKKCVCSLIIYQLFCVLYKLFIINCRFNQLCAFKIGFY